MQVTQSPFEALALLGRLRVTAMLIPGRVDLQPERRSRSEPTVPTRLERELATNPFLRADNDDLRGRWGGSAPHETFAALRAAKDNF